MGKADFAIDSQRAHESLPGLPLQRQVLTQCKRHLICDDPKDYPHTHVNIDLDRAIKRALELKAFMKGVPYKRYGEGKFRG